MMSPSNLGLGLFLVIISIAVASKQFQKSFQETFLLKSLSELPLDENGRLQDNWLLYLDNPLCKQLAEDAWEKVEPAHRRVASVTSELALIYFPDEDPTTISHCSSIVLYKGMRSDYVQHVLPKDKLIITSDSSPTAFSEFLMDRSRAEVGWVSHSDRKMSIFWLDPTTGYRVLNGELMYGEKHTVWLGSVIGHEFIVVDNITGDILYTYEIECHSFFVIGESGTQTRLRDDAQQKIQDTLHAEWFRHKNVKRTFTELGFAKGQLPLDLFASMQTYYYNNRQHKLREEWDSKGVFVNWWEKDVYMIGMPWVLKRYWQSRLKDLVEAWSGVELELTDIYGMRRYEDGARLLTHVDREATHAASLIINVAQGSMRDPWAVEIYDHADRLHEINMNEGDIVYYESARCLHGRMKPLAGEFYVNLFAHYRPIGDPEWFTKENPKDSVKPLMDIGVCSVSPEGNGTTCTGGAKIPSLSPKLETLTGPGDLYQYWLKTAPEAPAAAHATATNDEL